MFRVKAKIVCQEKVGNNYFRCVIDAPRIAGMAHAGQFLNIKLSGKCGPLLRRPFSIHRAFGSKIEILYAALGPGTEVFSRKRLGEYLDVIGPLGNGFDWEAPAAGNNLKVLVAGGMGVAPLLFLAESIVTGPGGHGARSKPIVLIGAKTKNQIICEKAFKELGCSVKISTDDGSRGFKGKVTDLLKRVLWLTNNDERLTIFACGPRPMLKEVSRLSAKFNVSAQISLEEHLACGIGACLGCAVKTKSGYQRVCTEGPVFDADEIV